MNSKKIFKIFSLTPVFHFLFRILSLKTIKITYISERRCSL